MYLCIYVFCTVRCYAMLCMHAWQLVGVRAELEAERRKGQELERVVGVVGRQLEVTHGMA
jgi:hypothetical protein